MGRELSGRYASAQRLRHHEDRVVVLDHVHGSGDGGRVPGGVKGRGRRGVAVIEGGGAMHGGLASRSTTQAADTDDAQDDDKRDSSYNSADQRSFVQPALLCLRRLGCACQDRT